MKLRLPKYLWLVGAVVVIFGLAWSAKFVVSPKQGLQSASSTYIATNSQQRVTDVASEMGPITRVKVTPDNKLMLVANLLGDVFVLTKTKTGWQKQSQLFYKVEHKMNPAGENGLTGLIVSSNYLENHFIFLTYTQRQSGGRGENQILRLRVSEENGVVLGIEPKVIFRGNTQMLGAHQIQGGVGVEIQDKPHLLFAVGEGYQEQHARDITKEAGKLMLIQEDGTEPLGKRPYPNYPKIQAIGIRNVYDVTLDPKKPDWVYFTQNGSDANDILIHVPILDGRQYDFNWRSESRPATLLEPMVDGVVTPEYVIRNWEVTVSPNDIVVDRQGRIYFTIFSSSRYPNKEVVMGKQINGIWAWEVVAKRNSSVAGGNPLGLALGVGEEIYFGDMFDGVVYQLK